MRGCVVIEVVVVWSFHDWLGEWWWRVSQVLSLYVSCMCASVSSTFILWHRTAGNAWTAHLCKDSIQPLERAVEVDFNPAGNRCYRLSSVVGSPSLDEAHSNGAHSGELVDCLESLINCLSQEVGKLLIRKDLEVTSMWYFTNCCRMPSVSLVTVGTLYKNGLFTEALGKDFSSNVVQPDSTADVPSSLFNDGTSIDVGERS